MGQQPYHKKDQDASWDSKPVAEQTEGLTNGNSGWLVIGIVSTAPIALIVLPLMIWLGSDLLKAALLTLVVQLLTFFALISIGLYRTSHHVDLPEARNNSLQSDTDTAPIWRSYSSNKVHSNVPRVALIARDTLQSRRMATDLSSHGYDLHHTTDVDAMLEAIRARPFDWDFAILDLDLFEDLDDAIDELTLFRRDCRDIPILLLSGSAARDEFSGHRRAIGDATLRKPVFRSRLLEGIEAMKANSAIKVVD